MYSRRFGWSFSYCKCTLTFEVIQYCGRYLLLFNILSFFPNVKCFCFLIFLAQWRCIPGALKQIDTGYSRAVWGVNRAGQIWKLKRNRRSWRNVGGRLIHVSAGEGGIWGVSRGHNIYYRIGRFFQSNSFFFLFIFCNF